MKTCRFSYPKLHSSAPTFAVSDWAWRNRSSTRHSRHGAVSKSPLAIHPPNKQDRTPKSAPILVYSILARIKHPLWPAISLCFLSLLSSVRCQSFERQSKLKVPNVVCGMTICDSQISQAAKMSAMFTTGILTQHWKMRRFLVDFVACEFRETENWWIAMNCWHPSRTTTLMPLHGQSPLAVQAKCRKTRGNAIQMETSKSF